MIRATMELAMPVDGDVSTALIVGASRGLGLALAQEYLARGWRVVATQRAEAGSGLRELVGRFGDRLEIERLDITRSDEIRALRTRLSGRRLDLLFVNAGVTNDPRQPVGEVSTEEFIRVLVTNALGPMRAIEAFEDLVPTTGMIAAMSSGLGSVGDNENGGWEVYRASKAALNTLMRSFAARHKESDRSLALVAPGWVRTDMGGPGAPLDVETSVTGVVNAIAAQTGRPGLRYLDYQGRTVRW
jgi:NAD(P)-dependent dehydrogenase (short-subunit alcohol dehydrogenase family)